MATRLYIEKEKDSPLQVHAFLDPRFAPVSAIWAVDLNGEGVIRSHQPMAVIHNPLATNPLPSGFLPCDEEYVATPLGPGKFQLEKVPPSSGTEAA